MNSSPWRGGSTGAHGEGWLNSSQWSSPRWRLDEQEPVDDHSQVEARGGRRWMNSSSWRLERSTVEMNSSPWSPVLWYATPLPMNRTPVSTVALQHKSVSSVLRYATPLPMNRTPVSTVALQHKSVSSVLRYARPLPMNKIPFRTWPVEDKAVSSVLRYVRPHFHRLFRPSRLAPDE